MYVLGKPMCPGINEIEKYYDYKITKNKGNNQKFKTNGKTESVEATKCLDH